MYNDKPIQSLKYSWLTSHRWFHFVWMCKFIITDTWLKKNFFYKKRSKSLRSGTKTGTTSYKLLDLFFLIWFSCLAFLGFLICFSCLVFLVLIFLSCFSWLVFLDLLFLNYFSCLDFLVLIFFSWLASFLTLFFLSWIDPSGVNPGSIPLYTSGTFNNYPGN